jgi:hypothetical protein
MYSVSVPNETAPACYATHTHMKQQMADVTPHPPSHTLTHTQPAIQHAYEAAIGTSWHTHTHALTADSMSKLLCVSSSSCKAPPSTSCCCGCSSRSVPSPAWPSPSCTGWLPGSFWLLLWSCCVGWSPSSGCWLLAVSGGGGGGGDSWRQLGWSEAKAGEVE